MLVLEPTTTRSRLKSVLVTQSIAVVGFVLVPLLITLMAPLSTIMFEKSGAGTTVVVHRYVLMFIPWQTERIDNVTRIHADITPEKRYRDTRENRRKGNIGTRLATAQLEIVGDGPEVIVQADPDLAKNVAARFDAFARNAAAPPEKIEVYASWGLSYVLGGVATFLCGFYLLGATIAVLQFVWKAMRRAR